MAGDSGLEQGFRQPPDAAKPWAYWWWIKGNVTGQSITRDLKEMKRQGIGGLLMFDSRGYHEGHVPLPPSRMEFMSPQWRNMLKFAMSEANRLGLKMSMNLSSGAGALKGPWDVGNNAPKRLLWTSSTVQGPQRIQVGLRPGDAARFWDVAIVAARHDESKVTKESPSTALNLSDNWREAVTKPQSKSPVTEVVDLSNKVDGQRRLTWNVPEGQWTLFRFACVIIEGYETDVDILNAQAVETYFDRMGKTILKDAGPLAGKTLTHFYSVSWEGAAPTWTFGFEEEFKKYRGYDLRPYLPVLAGLTVKNQEVTQRFLRDYSRTLSDCFLNNGYAKLRDLCHQAGLKIHCESGGPWDRNKLLFANADQLAFLGRNDMPQAEFWHPWAKKQTNARRTAMTAHIYGLPLAATEAFTNMTFHWSAYPAVLKPAADATFCDGINFFVWHTFTASPAEFGKPGIEYFAGTHLNPNVTWWEQARAFLDYLARCQFMLRQGRFVSDVCCYTSDRNYETWGRGEKWSKEPSLVLPKGYAYDLINTEVLLGRLSVKDGRLVLPDGMSYRMLVVDLEEKAAVPEALRKIIELAEMGATVVLGRRRPEAAPGLTNFPACDEEVRRLAEKLWGSGEKKFSRVLGKGQVIGGTAMDEVLRAESLLPDFAGPWDYIHRRSADADIYFVAGEGHAECGFRVAGREPELWDPVTGQIRDAVWYQSNKEGRTTVPITLPKNGSVFVVFRTPARAKHVVAVTASANSFEIKERTKDGVGLRLWQPGRYVFETSLNEKKPIEAAQLSEPLTFSGPWEVRFAPGWGAPESVMFSQLIPWNEHPHEGIKYFSGTATYRTTFDLDKKQARQPIRLQLGLVKHVAHVRLNGRSLGVVWTDPWTVDLTGAVKPGKNELEIEVTNLWVNRLIGDARLPVEKRLTKTNVPLDAQTPGFRGYSPDTPLETSGLLGPVRLEFGEEHGLDF